MTTSSAKKLELALDVEHVRGSIEHALTAMSLPHRGAKVRVARVFPSGDGLCLQYAVDLAGQTRPNPVLLCAFLPALADQTPQWSDRSDVLRLSASGLVLPIFPFDPALPALPDFLASSPRLLAWLDRCGIAVDSTSRVETTVLAYRLQKRCVLQHDIHTNRAGTTRVVTKLLNPRRTRTAALAWSTAAASGVRLPRLLAIDATNGLLGIEYVHGRSLHDCIDEGTLPTGCAEAARLLAQLHSGSAGALASYAVRDELSTLERVVSLMNNFYPAVADAARERIHRLECRVPESTMLTPVHRDFYDKQILLSAQGATMLDWDGLAAGDAAIDVGNFLAHLQLRSLQHPGARPSITEGERQFRALAAVDGDRLEWWRSASLIRLALLYRWRPRWHGLFETLLFEADQALNVGGMS